MIARDRLRLWLRFGDVVVAVRSFQATAEERASALSRWEAAEIVRQLDYESAGRELPALYELATGARTMDTPSAGRQAFLRRVLAEIEGRHLLLVRAARSGARSKTRALDHGPEAAAVRRLMRGRRTLPFEGRQYRVITASTWNDLPDREDFHVVSAGEARGVLARMAAGPQTPAEDRAAITTVASLLNAPGPRPAEELLLLRQEARPTHAPAVLEPALTPSQLAKAMARARFDLVLLAADSGSPLVDVPLQVTTPDGATRTVRTDAAGAIGLADLEPGSCTVTSIVDGSEMRRAYALQGAGPPGKGETTGKGDRRQADGPVHLVDAAVHRVRTGETPATIAKAWGVLWDDIARFNWGTTDPDALEDHYRDHLGCARRGPGGGHVFDDDDDPGVLLVPRPWEQSFPTGAAHTLYLSPLRTLTIALETEAGLPIPGTPYHLRFVGGQERTGVLGRRGIARLAGVPDEPFAVSYPDEQDILAKSFAASIRKAFDEQATGPLFQLLMQDQSVIDRAAAAYADHFDDLTGQGLAADIDQVVTDPEARRPLLALCALAGLAIEGSGDLVLSDQLPSMVGEGGAA